MHNFRQRSLLLLALSPWTLAACGDDPDSEGGVDASTDAYIADGGATDEGAVDGRAVDGRAVDGNVPDSAPDVPASAPDSATGDAGPRDFAPYFHDDFESYEDGARLTSNMPFDAAGRSTVSSEEAFDGNQSARMAIQSEDNGGFGQWGGVIPIRPAVAEGEEVWVRLYVYWPEDFEFSASPWMKFLRLHNRTAEGENGGYNDLYIDNADGPESVLRTIKEVHDVWAVNDGEPIPHGRWERYEMYLYVDHTAVDDGGSGRVRIWRDGERIFDRTDVPTVTAEGGVINAFYLFTYWNNEMPPNNHCYVDDLTIATSASPPPERDGDGNPVIGDWRP